MFNKRLREMRMKRNYTQQYMADSLDLALRTYQCYETGSRTPSYQSLVSLSDTLCVSTDYLLGRDEFLLSLGVCVDEYQ